MNVHCNAQHLLSCVEWKVLGDSGYTSRAGSIGMDIGGAEMGMDGPTRKDRGGFGEGFRIGWWHL